MAKRKAMPQFIRDRVWQKHQGICAICGMKIWELIDFLFERLPEKARDQMMVELGIAHRKTFWDVDHITPISQGGSESGLDNLQALCIWCHRKKSRGDFSNTRTSGLMNWTEQDKQEWDES